MLRPGLWNSFSEGLRYTGLCSLRSSLMKNRVVIEQNEMCASEKEAGLRNEDTVQAGF